MKPLVIGATLLSAATLLGCSGMESDQQGQRAAIATAETTRIIAECEAKRLQGKVAGYSGAHLCADGRYREAWAKAHYPYSDLILHFWTRKGILVQALDTGEISQTQYALMLDEFNAQLLTRLDARFAREEAARARRSSTALMLWQGLQSGYQSGQPSYRSPTYCTTTVPPPSSSGQTQFARTRCY